MTPPRIDLVAGARPNFVKLAAVSHALRADGRLTARIVHTGQHYHAEMSRIFFEQLDIEDPEVFLDVGSGTHGRQTARCLERYEAQLLASRPDASVVFGDVNSTLACALAAAKTGVPVAHVEAGLRSFDRTMPEELNRVLTDAIADLLLVSEPSGMINLAAEGTRAERIRLVGNVMIDTLRRVLPEAREQKAARKYGFRTGSYGLITMHRPSNVDDPTVLQRLFELFEELATELPLLVLLHPRTRAAIQRAGLGRPQRAGRDLILLDAQPYIENLSLMADAVLVLTDSGGIQEETSALGVPCLTLRPNTERPVTLKSGTSRLVGQDPDKVRAAFRQVMAGDWPQGTRIPLWDGHAAERVVEELATWLKGKVP